MRIVIADDALLLREGIAQVLRDEGFEILAKVEDAAALLRAVDADPPDICIVDIRMPPSHTDEGLQAARAIRAKHPDVAVLVLSQYAEPGVAMELLAASPERVGYLLKDRVADPEAFAASVRRVAEGGAALDPEVVSTMIGRRRQHSPLQALDQRERSVLSLMAEGQPNAAIADRLGVSERAVDMTVRDLIGKLSLEASAHDQRRVLAVLTFLGAERRALDRRAGRAGLAGPRGDGGERVAAGAVAGHDAGLERAAGAARDLRQALGDDAVALDHDVPGAAVPVLIDLELDLDAAVLGAQLDLRLAGLGAGAANLDVAVLGRSGHRARAGHQGERRDCKAADLDLPHAHEGPFVEVRLPAPSRLSGRHRNAT